jgi:hypothetical protein
MKPQEEGVEEEEVICTSVLLSPGSSKLKLLYTIGSLNTTVELSLPQTRI